MIYARVTLQGNINNIARSIEDEEKLLHSTCVRVPSTPGAFHQSRMGISCIRNIYIYYFIGGYKLLESIFTFFDGVLHVIWNFIFPAFLLWRKMHALDFPELFSDFPDILTKRLSHLMVPTSALQGWEQNLSLDERSHLFKAMRFRIFARCHFPLAWNVNGTLS